MSLLSQALVFLAAAALIVPLAKSFGLGAVLGYLFAGVLIGPQVLGLFDQVEGVLHFAEFGVVLLMFIIGLELQPRRLWVMRRSVFGLGLLQVLASTALLAGIAVLIGLDPATALVIGIGLSLSSTALALQTLAERGELASRHGRAAFSVLLLQDLAVIPALALIPLLTPGGMENTGNMWLQAGEALAVVTGVIVGGHFLLRQIIRGVAAVQIREIFTATALLIVVATALLMEHVGMSMALGAFLAGVLLADSEYRHQLEADIEPLKSLLLGLFFMAVGMSVNLHLVVAQLPLTVALVLGLVLVKALVLFVLGRVHGLDKAQARRLAVSVSQGGEFAFVIFTAAVTRGILSDELADLLVAVVSLSMALTPLLLVVVDRLDERSALASASARRYEEPPPDRRVIIAGFGRMGQIVARILRAKKIAFTALEISPEQVDFVKKYGNEVYYGDASQLDLLRAAGTAEADAFILAIDQPAASLRTAEVVRRNFPNLKIFARARNRKHAYQLMDLGIEVVWRETFHTSLELSRSLLRALGIPGDDSDKAVERFRQFDEARLYAHRELHGDEAKMMALARASAKELEELFEQDAAEGQSPS
jgi:monovalent cation:proton antiporter-2 (CPA2) family protein